MNRKKITRSAEETERFAAELASEFGPGAVLALRGDLGAGKTVFARGFAKAIGVRETVSSPTYTLVHEYKLDNGGRFYHLDLYRIGDHTAALAFGVDEYLEDPAAFALVEWPERIEPLLGPEVIHVEIRHEGESTREITVSKKPRKK